MYIYDFITYVDGVVIELKNVKLFTENSEYLKLRCIFYIIRLNRSIVYDIEHLASGASSFMVYNIDR